MDKDNRHWDDEESKPDRAPSQWMKGSNVVTHPYRLIFFYKISSKYFLVDV